MVVNIHTHQRSAAVNPAIINVSFDEAEKIYASQETGFFSVGIHPWDVNEYADTQLEKLEKYLTDKRFVALGECGLDKNSNVPLAKQLFVFNKQIEISERMRKPLIVHCVGCFNELLELKTKLKPRQLWIIHGFRGKPQLARQILKNGCALSFGEHFNEESVRVTPTESLYIETDESHVPVEDIYAKIAAIKNCTPNELTAGAEFFSMHTEHY